MKKIKQVYYYLFYKLYKYAEKSPTIFPYDFIAGTYLEVLIVFIVLSLINYSDCFVRNFIDFGSGKSLVLLLVLFITIPNYFIFYHKDQWKDIVKEFDKLPKEKDKKYGIIVWSIIILIIGNMLFSFYLLFAQAKKNQTGPYAPEIVAKERREDSLQKAKQIEKLKKIYGEDKK